MILRKIHEKVCTPVDSKIIGIKTQVNDDFRIQFVVDTERVRFQRSKSK